MNPPEKQQRVRHTAQHPTAHLQAMKEVIVALGYEIGLAQQIGRHDENLSSEQAKSALS